MKKLLLYMLLFTYSTIMLKPAMPYMSDTVSHLLWYNEHMATVHLENGKYHVHKESFAIAKKANPDQNNDLLKKAMQQTDHLVFSSLYDLSIPSLLNTHNTAYCFTEKSVSPLPDFPPPRI